MTPLRPTAPKTEDSELWDRVLAAADARGLEGDDLRAAVMRYAVTELCARIEDDIDIQALINAVLKDDDADGLYGACSQARELGLQSKAAVLVLFLIAERTTSFAGASPYGQALAEAAERVFADGTATSGEVVSKLMTEHGDAFVRFLTAERELTAELLDGLESVTLYRGVRMTAPGGGELNPQLRPLSSFSTSASCAISLAEHGPDAGSQGDVVLLSAAVPVERILATPGTGAGAVLEREVVIAVGDGADRVAVSRPIERAK
jgi:hypothetical protein